MELNATQLCPFYRHCCHPEAGFFGYLRVSAIFGQGGFHGFQTYVLKWLTLYVDLCFLRVDDESAFTTVLHPTCASSVFHC